MKYSQLSRWVHRQAKYIRDRAPKDTGNLRASIRVEEIEPFIWRIFVNIGDDTRLRVSRNRRNLDWGLAPYAPFTNEPWISAYWRGKQNPNEGWWNKAVDLVMRNFEMETNGILEKKDVID